MNASEAQTFHADLAGTPHSVPLARLYLRQELRKHVPGEVLATAELLVSELVTNVVLHAKTSIHIGVTWDSRNLLITVQDSNQQTPQERQRHLGDDQLAESGRGLMLIDGLADDFGWSRLADGTGKVMWFVLAIPPPVPEQRPTP